MSQNQEEEGLSSETQHNMPDDLTIWKEVAPKGKKGKLYGLGSIGTNASKYTIGSCSNAFKDKNIEQELLKWEEMAKEQERIKGGKRTLSLPFGYLLFEGSCCRTCPC
jgi:hypothetical protein